MTMKVWVNEERTVLVRTWRDPGVGKAGEEIMEVAVRSEPDAIWGPPVLCRPERT